MNLLAHPKFQPCSPKFRARTIKLILILDLTSWTFTPKLNLIHFRMFCFKVRSELFYCYCAKHQYPFHTYGGSLFRHVIKKLLYLAKHAPCQNLVIHRLSFLEILPQPEVELSPKTSLVFCKSFGKRLQSWHHRELRAALLGVKGLLTCLRELWHSVINTSVAWCW